MAKTITIPNCKNPYVVIINNRRYVYTAGETVEVSDEVAEVIQHDIDTHSNMTAPQGESTCGHAPILVVTMKYERANSGKEYYSCDTPYDKIASAIGKKAVVAWYGGTQVFAKKTGDIISFTGLVRNGDHQYEWYYSTNA